MKHKNLIYLPLALILLGILAVYWSGLYHDLNFHMIKLKHAEWKASIAKAPVLSALYFMAIYIASVCLILPDSTILTLAAGFLFPFPLALLYVLLSETIGATLFFQAAKASFSAVKTPFSIPFTKSIHAAFSKHPISYLLFFRLSHLLPFWVINLGCAYLKMGTRTFFWTTLVGLFPLTFVLVEGGAGLSKYFDTNESFHIGAIFNTQVKCALLALSLLALLPIWFTKKK